MKSNTSNNNRQKTELSPAVQGTGTRRVSLHVTVCFNDTIYRVPEELIAELAGQSIYVCKSPETGKVRGERVNYDIVPVDDAVFELREMASEKVNPPKSSFSKEDCEEALDNLGTHELRVIAQYEMWESLELKFMQPFTERFLATLDEEDQELANRYCAAKIAVLGGNSALSVNHNIKAGAEA